MATTAPTRSNGRSASGAGRPAIERAGVTGRRRQLPLVVVGVLLVVGCALVFAEVSLHSARGEDVLVVSEPLAPGTVVTPADLHTVRLSAPSGVATVPAGDMQAVVGQPAAVALSPGTVLTRGDVGAGAGVAAGADVVAVALKPGAYPPDLAPGDRVKVVPVASSSGSGSTATTGTGPVPATVLAVEAPSATSGSPAVLSLQVARADAATVASLAAAGEVALVEEGSGG